ncbi:hypothetical protein [Algibacter mikhailovii]|nr:hypothetical protein [Algibacter mikhailovii]
MNYIIWLLILTIQKSWMSLRNEMDRWIFHVGDQPNLPEVELIHQL